MARPLRIEYAGAFYHVMHRGNAGTDIFKNDRDREKILEYFGKAVERYEIKIHTYCLMTNHYHFLIETPHPNLSQAIKWVNVSYATYFNRKRDRAGHLFQGRFKAILVDADEYLKQLSRYIHLNPIRAKIVGHLKDYQWSSYPAFAGYVKAPQWLETKWLLSLFGKNKKRYRNFVEKVQNIEIENPSKDVVHGLILGSADYVKWIKTNFIKKEADTKDKPQLRNLKPRILLEDLILNVCKEFDCEREIIIQKGLKRNDARDVAIFLSREMTGESGVALGRFFGGISGAGITVRYNYLQKKIQNDRRFKNRIKRVKQKIIKN
jgi:REP element-mobilizing transposase RayT